MAAKAQVGDKRKRKDGHTWQKVGEGKWKRLPKKKEDSDEASTEKAKPAAESKKERFGPAEWHDKPKKSDEEIEHEVEVKQRELQNKYRVESGLEPLPEVPPLKKSNTIQEARAKDGPGPREVDDLNPGDLIKVGDDEVELVGIVKGDSYDEIIVRDPGDTTGRSEQVPIPLDPGQKIERTYQKETNEQRAEKAEKNKEFQKEVKRWVGNPQAHGEGWRQGEEARRKRSERRMKRGGSEHGVSSPLERGPPAQRMRAREKHIEDQLLSGRGTVDPAGDYNAAEIAGSLNTMVNRGLVRRRPDGGHELTEAGLTRRRQRVEARQGRRRWRGRRMSEEELKRKKREYAERYRREKGVKEEKQKVTTEEEAGAMIAEAQAALDRRRAKRGGK
jgi:hypothetical protein